MSKQDTKPAPKSTEKHPPETWCKRLGLFAAGRASSDGSLTLSAAVPHWTHNAASALHGWTLHEHHAGEPMRLSEFDYLAALKAAEGPTYKPHAAALSPHAPWAKD